MLRADLNDETITFTNFDNQVIELNAAFVSCKRQPIDRNELVQRLEVAYRSMTPVRSIIPMQDKINGQILDRYVSDFNQWAHRFEPASVIEPKT